MDTKTRAEKIVLEGREGLVTSFEKHLIGKITSQLDEAVREGISNCKWTDEWTKLYYAKGFSSARDKAAGIAEEADGWHPVGKQYANEIAERIRNLSVTLEDK